MIIFWILVILVDSVILHEFGHYLTARHYGVIAQEFNLGMGPRICGFERGGTKWNVRLFMFGGSCVFGKNDDELMTLKTTQRIAVMAAGPFTNLFLGFVCLVTAALVRGGDMLSYIASALYQGVMMIPSMFVALTQIMSLDYPTLAETGTAAMATTDGMTLAAFTAYVLVYAYLFNVVLFYFNIIPIPALDGGQILLAIPELFGHPIKEKTVNALNYVFFMLIMGFSMLYIVKDFAVTMFNAFTG